MRLSLQTDYWVLRTLTTDVTTEPVLQTPPFFSVNLIDLGAVILIIDSSTDKGN